MLEWEWYTNLNTFRVFLHMLLKANWKDGKFQGQIIERGSFISSIAKISQETGLTVNEVRTAVKNLKSTGEITSKSHSKYSVFTVKNYSVYQDINTQENNHITSKPQADNKQVTNRSQPVNNLLTTIEEREEEKEVEEGKKERREEKDYSVIDATCQTDVRRIVDAWNQCGAVEVKTLSTTSKRYQMLKARIKEYGVDQVLEAVEMIKGSPFLLGQNKNGWTISFDWFVKPNNFPKVSEGYYLARNQGKTENGYNQMLKGWAESE